MVFKLSCGRCLIEGFENKAMVEGCTCPGKKNEGIKKESKGV